MPGETPISNTADFMMLGMQEAAEVSKNVDFETLPPESKNLAENIGLMGKLINKDELDPEAALKNVAAGVFIDDKGQPDPSRDNEMVFALQQFQKMNVKDFKDVRTFLAQNDELSERFSLYGEEAVEQAWDKLQKPSIDTAGATVVESAAESAGSQPETTAQPLSLEDIQEQIKVGLESDQLTEDEKTTLTHLSKLEEADLRKFVEANSALFQDKDLLKTEQGREKLSEAFINYLTETILNGPSGTVMIEAEYTKLLEKNENPTDEDKAELHNTAKATVKTKIKEMLVKQFQDKTRKTELKQNDLKSPGEILLDIMFWLMVEAPSIMGEQLQRAR